MSNHESSYGATPLKHFTPAWWVALFRAGLGFGDTFWIGVFGTQFLFIPFWFVVVALVIAMDPTRMPTVLLVLTGFFAVYFVALLPAVVITALRNKTAQEWRWVAIVIASARAVPGRAGRGGQTGE